MRVDQLAENAAKPSPRASRVEGIIATRADDLSPERERVGFGTRLEERDLQSSLVHRLVLADELVQAAVPQ